jgi:hypothetical protein
MKRPSVPVDPIQRRCRAALEQLRRKARADGQQLVVDLEDLVQLAHDRPTCPYCGNLVPANLLTFDHRQPICRGGAHSLANLTACCRPCNMAKGLMTAEEFADLRRLIRTFHPRAHADILARLRAGGTRYRGNSRRPPAAPGIGWEEREGER